MPTTPTTTPVIVTAFANDHAPDGSFLPRLAAEARGIREALRAADRDGRCKHVELQNATTGDVVNALLFHGHEIAVFHYGGHASAATLLFQNIEGGGALVPSGPLAAFLRDQTGLALVFLNGCCTQPQIEALLRPGLTVIGTRTYIMDDAATDFATRFYELLARGDSIERAYNQTGHVVSLRGTPRDVIDARLPGGTEAIDDGSWPWVMESRPSAPPAREWSLRAPLSARVGNAVTRSVARLAPRHLVAALLGVLFFAAVGFGILMPAPSCGGPHPPVGAAAAVGEVAIVHPVPARCVAVVGTESLTVRWSGVPPGKYTLWALVYSPVAERFYPTRLSGDAPVGLIDEDGEITHAVRFTHRQTYALVIALADRVGDATLSGHRSAGVEAGVTVEGVAEAAALSVERVR